MFSYRLLIFGSNSLKTPKRQCHGRRGERDANCAAILARRNSYDEADGTATAPNDALLGEYEPRLSIYSFRHIMYVTHPLKAGREYVVLLAGDFKSIVR